MQGASDLVSGLIISFFLALTALTFKALAWVFPRTFKLYVKEISAFLNKDTNAKLEDIKQELLLHKREKLEAEGEKLALREILKIDDPELRKHILEIFDKQHPEKNSHENS